MLCIRLAANFSVVHSVFIVAGDMCPRGGGVGLVPIMAYTRKVRTKGVPFSGFRYKFRYIKGKGNRSFRYLKGPLIIIFRIDARCGCISLFIEHYMKTRGYSQKNWVGVCGPLLKTPSLFMTKICDIPYHIYHLTKNSIPYL